MAPAVKGWQIKILCVPVRSWLAFDLTQLALSAIALVFCIFTVWAILS